MESMLAKTIEFINRFRWKAFFFEKSSDKKVEGIKDNFNL